MSAAARHRRLPPPRSELGVSQKYHNAPSECAHCSMSLRPRREQVPVSRLEVVLRAGLRLGQQSISAPLQGEVSLLRRGNDEHLDAVAVLAYTNLWDGFVNRSFREDITTSLRKFENPGLYAAAFAFFADEDKLRELCPVPGVYDEHGGLGNITLVREPDWYQPAAIPASACYLRLVHSGLRESVVNVLSFIGTSKNWDELPKKAFEGAVLKIRERLQRLSKPRLGRHIIPVDDGFNRLFRGVAMPPGKGGLDACNEMQGRFTSTSMQQSVAKDFALLAASEAIAAKTERTELFMIKILADETVKGIGVNSVLDNPWQCHPEEREVILHPTTEYTVVGEEDVVAWCPDSDNDEEQSIKAWKLVKVRATGASGRRRKLESV